MINFFDISHSTPMFLGAVAFLYFVNFIIALTIIFIERKDPAATLAWILVLFLLPAFGILCYFFFSQNISRQKIFKLTKDEESIMTDSLQKQEDKISQGTFSLTNYGAEMWKDLIRLNQVYGRAYYTQDNDIENIIDGKDLMNRFLKDIKGAKESINVMFFIVKADSVGKELINALTEKAKEGVRVRFLVDALGSRHLRKSFFKEYVKAGGEYAYFFPPKFFLFKYFNPKLNYRNHRKLAAIDDDIGYIGGFNVAKEYLGKKKKFGYWRDSHIRVTGGCVQDINCRFLQDWRFASGEKVNITEVFYKQPIGEGNVGVQIVSGGPDTEHEEIKRAFLKMITSARRKIYIHTPYFVPDTSILESLKMAAQSGVDVKIMIPCKPDHIFVYWATYSYVSEIIKNGGRVFIYDNGFLHSKVMTVDSEVSTVGSTNFDRRSFKLNFESNAFIYDEEETIRLEKIYENDMTHCHELTKELYDRRSTWIKIKEPIARILSDIL